jgi:DNA-binding transcriptional ArsR family regulator
MKNDKDKCETVFVHEDKVKNARKALHNNEKTLALSETFGVLSDPTRLNIVVALSKEELCVCDIAALLGMTDSAISHQLRVLKNLRLVKYWKKGKMAYYSLDDEHIEDLIRIALRHASER